MIEDNITEVSLEKIVNSITDIILVMNTNYEIEYANKSAEKEFGKEIIRSKCHKVTHNKDKKCIDCIVEKLRDNNGPIIKYESNEKTGRYYEVRYFKVEDEKTEHYKIIKILRDITETKQLEDKLKQLQKEQEIFLRHELNNHISIIKGFSELLVDELDTDEAKEISNVNEIKEYAETILRITERSEIFIKNVKRIQNFENKISELKKVKYHLNEQLENEIHEFKAIYSDVELKYFDNSTNTMVYMDKIAMSGVFDNLIKNSIEHTIECKSKDPVIIKSYNQEDNIIVEINNKGKALSSKQVKHFFDKYNTQKNEGTGLGTTYAKLVTNAHSGKIEVTSNEKEGTTVRLCFKCENE